MTGSALGLARWKGHRKMHIRDNGAAKSQEGKVRNGKEEVN